MSDSPKRVKAWRFYECVFAWSLFSLFPSVRPLVETPWHGPGWALYWLGFECSFERMVNRNYQLVPWARATSRERREELEIT